MPSINLIRSAINLDSVLDDTNHSDNIVMQEYDETMVSLGKQLEEDKRRKDMMMRDQAKELAMKEEEEKRLNEKKTTY